MRPERRPLAVPLLWAIVAAASVLAQPPQTELPASGRSREVIARIRPRLTAGLAEKNLAWGAPIFIRIFKETAELEVWLRSGSRFVLFKSYPICYFSGRLGPKQREWDGQAPEGFYYVTPAQLQPYSLFHLAFDIGYPNVYDRAAGCTGNAIHIHGGCASIGCFAMTDASIEEIYALVEAAFRGGQPFFRVHVFPFRMTPENLGRHRESEWGPFWMNLKEGYDLFTRTGRPPNVLAHDGRYFFTPTS